MSTSVSGYYKIKKWHGPQSHWCREGKTLVVRPLILGRTNIKKEIIGLSKVWVPPDLELSGSYFFRNFFPLMKRNCFFLSGLFFFYVCHLLRLEQNCHIYSNIWLNVVSRNIDGTSVDLNKRCWEMVGWLIFVVFVYLYRDIQTPV